MLNTFVWIIGGAAIAILLKLLGVGWAIATAFLWVPCVLAFILTCLGFILFER